MTVKRSDDPDIRRRRVLRGAMFGAGALLGAGLSASPAAADAKSSHKLVHYQESPNGQARCQTCAQFQPGPACRLVADPIVPTGWCLLYAAKAG
jgi:hypothetical protein